MTSPPTKQKKATNPAALNPGFAYKNFWLQTVGGVWGFFSTSYPFSFLGPAINLFLLQTLTSWFGLTVPQAHKLAFDNNCLNFYNDH